MINNVGINMLYAAIFKAAVDDDKIDVKKMIGKALEKKEYKEKEILNIMTKHEGLIEKKIKQYVWEESQNWPKNRKIDTQRNKQKIVNTITKPYIFQKWLEKERISELKLFKKSWHRMAHFFLIEW
jgi:hypothetical protein